MTVVYILLFHYFLEHFGAVKLIKKMLLIFIFNILTV